jgi:hypothetical protein
MSESIEPLPAEFTEDGHSYAQVIRSKHWAVLKQDKDGNVRYVVSPIVVRNGRERFANPRYNEVYGYEFPTEEAAIEVFLQSRDIVIA